LENKEAVTFQFLTAVNNEFFTSNPPKRKWSTKPQSKSITISVKTQK